MNSQRRIFFFALIVAILADPASSSKKTRTPSDSELSAGAWIGLSEDWDLLVRLELRSDGSGKCAWVGGGSQAFRFEISSWRRQQHGILLEVPSSSEIQRANIAFAGSQLDLRVRGETWKRRVRLYREASLESRWKTL